MLSLLPADVGSSPRCSDTVVVLPRGEVLKVRYLGLDGRDLEATGTRDEVAAALRAAGYRVAPGIILTADEASEFGARIPAG